VPIGRCRDLAERSAAGLSVPFRGEVGDPAAGERGLAYGSGRGKLARLHPPRPDFAAKWNRGGRDEQR
jgi:hypothetical protein